MNNWKGFFYRIGIAIKDLGGRWKLADVIRAGLVVKGWASK